jgi:hypothetical protein
MNRTIKGLSFTFAALGITAAVASQGQLYLPTTGTYSGLQAANYTNGAIDALATCNKGPAAPTNALGAAAVTGQCWLDDSSANMMIKKRYSGTAWVVEGVIDVAGGVWSPPVGGGAGTVNAAATTDLCARRKRWSTLRAPPRSPASAGTARWAFGKLWFSPRRLP